MIGPLIRERGTVMRKHPRIITGLRFGWHLGGMMMLVTAILLARPGVSRYTSVLIGGAWLLLGLLNLGYMRGQQRTWMLQVVAGATALVAVA